MSDIVDYMDELRGQFEILRYMESIDNDLLDFKEEMVKN